MAGLESLSDALAPELIWKTLWPVLVGVGLFIGLRPSLPRLPNIPNGDIAALAEPVSRAVPTLGVAIERLDSVLRLWTPACLMLLMIVILLLVAMAAGG